MTHTGFFERYFITPFFRRYSDFRGSGNSRDAMISVGAWLIVTAGVIGVSLGFVGLLGPEVGFVALGIIGGMWFVVSVCPMTALVCRAMKGEEENVEPVRIRLLGIDRLLSAICLLFLIFGFLMMITTLNSGEINMNPRNGDDGDTENPILMQDSVWEEPIFTYQDQTPVEPEKDTLSDLVDQDTVSLDESFDPQITTEVPVEIDTLTVE